VRGIKYSENRHPSSLLASSSLASSSLLVPILAPNTGMNHLAVLSAETRTSAAQGWTVRNLAAGAAPPLRTSGQSALGARTVRNGVEHRLLHSIPRSRLPGENPIGEKRS
jgi:hypothetical protein